MCVSKIDCSIKPDETWIIKAIAIMAMLFHHLFLGGPEYGKLRTSWPGQAFFDFRRPLEVAYGENANVVRSFISDMLEQQSYSSYNITWWFNELILGRWLFLGFPL